MYSIIYFDWVCNCKKSTSTGLSLSGDDSREGGLGTAPA